MGCRGKEVTRSMVNFHEKAITTSCQVALQILKQQDFINNYYLAGGTALALQLGHRLSTDLDWFSTESKLLAPEREAIIRTLQASDQLRIISEQDSMLFVQLAGTDVSFIYQQHALLYETIKYLGIKLASPIDIGLMKLAAVNSRGTRRDFVDLYCLQDLVSLKQLLKLAEEKYANRPNFLAIAARALAYFEDAEQQPMPRMYIDVQWKDVKRYCETAARQLTRHLSGLE